MSSDRPPKTSKPPSGPKGPATASHPPRVSKPPVVFQAGQMPAPPPSKPPRVNSSIPPRTAPSKAPAAAASEESKPLESASPIEVVKPATPSQAPAVGASLRSNIFDAPSEPGLHVSELNAPPAVTAAAPSVLHELTQ